MEYKLDNIVKALNNIESKFANFDAILQMRNNQIPHDSLFNEFTTRGVLSSIKTVEKKLDRILVASQNKYLRSIESENDKPKLQIKCSTPKFIEDILNDISSKIDVIFDSFSDSKSLVDDTEDEYLETSEGSGQFAKSQTSIALLKKLIKRVVQPCKQTNQVLEEVLTRNLRAENILLQIVDKEHIILDLLNKEISLRKILDSSKGSTQDLIQNINIILDSYFNEQRVHFENILNKMKGNYCGNFQIHTKFHNSTVLAHSPTSSVKTANNIISENSTTASITSLTTTEKYVDYEDNVSPTWKPVLDSDKTSCEDLNFDNNSGVYIFEKNLEGTDKIFSNKRYCEIRNDGLWTVIQRRDNYTVQHNFNVSWEEYKNGFGNLHRDFWMGNELLYELSKNQPLLLRIELYDFENNFAWAEYSTFSVSNEDSKYVLTVSGYTGNASDSLSSHNGSAFSTYDSTNDEAPECCPCSLSYGGGWWFKRLVYKMIITIM